MQFGRAMSIACRLTSWCARLYGYCLQQCLVQDRRPFLGLGPFLHVFFPLAHANHLLAIRIARADTSSRFCVAGCKAVLGCMLNWNAVDKVLALILGTGDGLKHSSARR